MAENNIKENAKSFDETDLEKVDGGTTDIFNGTDKEQNMTIPANVREELPVVRNDEDFRKLLEERGIDVDKMTKKGRTSRLILNGDPGQQKSGNDNLA